MLISIIIGLCVWLVLPILLNGHVKKKKSKKAISLTCAIIGIAVIVWSVFRYVVNTLGE